MARFFVFLLMVCGLTCGVPIKLDSEESTDYDAFEPSVKPEATGYDEPSAPGVSFPEFVPWHPSKECAILWEYRNFTGRSYTLYTGQTKDFSEDGADIMSMAYLQGRGCRLTLWPLNDKQGTPYTVAALNRWDVTFDFKGKEIENNVRSAECECSISFQKVKPFCDTCL